MKNITAILFLFIYLLPTNGIIELLKVNMLVKHFYETKREDNSVTFFHFLVMHYVTDDLNDKDNNRDRQLPFKSTETCSSPSTALYIPCKNAQLMTSCTFNPNKKIFFTKKGSFTLPSFHTPVWHPPKYA
jgi:hypothetical protein